MWIFAQQLPPRLDEVYGIVDRESYSSSNSSATMAELGVLVTVKTEKTSGCGIGHLRDAILCPNGSKAFVQVAVGEVNTSQINVRSTSIRRPQLRCPICDMSCTSLQVPDTRRPSIRTCMAEPAIGTCTPRAYVEVWKTSVLSRACIPRAAKAAQGCKGVKKGTSGLRQPFCHLVHREAQRLFQSCLTQMSPWMEDSQAPTVSLQSNLCSFLSLASGHRVEDRCSSFFITSPSGGITPDLPVAFAKKSHGLNWLN